MSTLKNISKKLLAKNKKAKYDYKIDKTFSAGIVLKGHEVKSAKAGQISLKGAFVRIMNDEVWLLNAHIAKWRHTDLKDYDPTRRRKLLLKKREIKHLAEFQQIKKMSIIPLSVLNERGHIKVEIGAGKGRKKFDKRQKIKEEEIKRQTRRDLSKDKYF